MTINLTNLIYLLLIGLVAGWLANVFMKGKGSGLIGNMIVGVIGAFLGGWLLGKIGVSIGSGLVASLISAFIGAVALIFIVRLIMK